MNLIQRCRNWPWIGSNPVCDLGLCLYFNELNSLRQINTRWDFSTWQYMASKFKFYELMLQQGTKTGNSVVPKAFEPTNSLAVLTSNAVITPVKEMVSLTASPKPKEPTESECCMSGCARCVWDIYFEELEQFESKVSPKI